MDSDAKGRSAGERPASARVGFRLLLAVAVLAGKARAQDEFAEQPLAVHAFVSQGLIKTTANNYLASSQRGSFEFTEVGVNLTKGLTKDLRLGVQLFARDLGPLGNYSPQFDWFYLDYHYADWLGLRAGRTKLPFGLYNETSDIDSARIPVLLPPSIYPPENRDYLLAQTGLELYGYVPLGEGGDLEYRAYGGTIFLDASSNDEVEDLEIPYLIGGRLMWLTPLEGLQLGGSLQKLRLDLEYLPPPEVVDPLLMSGMLPMTFDGSVTVRLPVVMWIASIEYVHRDLQLAAEYSRWYVEVNSSVPVLVPETKTTSERAYLLGAYRVAPWLAPGLYYSVLFPDTGDRSGRESYQHDVAATLRFDFNEHWLVKAEGHLMVGTAALNPSLNDDSPRDELTKVWGAFLLKTTAYF
jgi:hypothetical protein